MCCCSTGLEELQRCADHKAKRCGGEAATGVIPSFLHCSLLRRTQPCRLHHDTQLLAGQRNKNLIALALQTVWLVLLRSHPSLVLLLACASLKCQNTVTNTADADDAFSILAIRDCACCCVSCDSAMKVMYLSSNVICLSHKIAPELSCVYQHKLSRATWSSQ